MLTRLYKTGNDIVLSLPQEVLDNLGVGAGESVSLELDLKQHRAIISPLENPPALPGVDEDFSRQVNEFIEKYRPALEELAK